ncbi:7832_t:CDS:2, partial [Gigaspora margarita]
LERYYNVIQRTYSILQEVFSSNKIGKLKTCAVHNLYYNFPNPNSFPDTRQLAGLCNEIKEVCEGSEVDYNIPTAEHSPDEIVFNSFEDALRESEPKIEEMDAEQNFPSFDRYH